MILLWYKFKYWNYYLIFILFFFILLIEWDWLFFILVFGLFGDSLLVLIVVVVVEILCLGFFFGW